MEVNIAICDDDENSLELIEKEIKNAAKTLEEQLNIFPYTYGKQLLEMLEKENDIYDILLLDIDMPDISGLDLAKKLRDVKSKTILIFISAHEHYVFESLEYNPFRYIRKSRIQEELFRGLKAACIRIKELEDKYIVIKNNDLIIKVKHSDIMYCEIQSRKLWIYLRTGESITVRKTIKELIEELNNDDFLQLHSGCIVNAKYIDEFVNGEIILDNGKRLIVSRTRIGDIKRGIMNYWENKI